MNAPMLAKTISLKCLFLFTVINSICAFSVPTIIVSNSSKKHEIEFTPMFRLQTSFTSTNGESIPSGIRPILDKYYTNDYSQSSVFELGLSVSYKYALCRFLKIGAGIEYTQTPYNFSRNRAGGVQNYLSQNWLLFPVISLKTTSPTYFYLEAEPYLCFFRCANRNLFAETEPSPMWIVDSSGDGILGHLVSENEVEGLLFLGFRLSVGISIPINPVRNFGAKLELDRGNVLFKPSISILL